jgi:hypothetical protein
MLIVAIALSFGNLTPPLDPVRVDGADAGLLITTPLLPLGNGDCGVYPFTYYDSTCAHPAWDIGSVFGGFHIAGEPVFAVSSGTIAALDPDGFCGIDVFVDHGDGVFSRYCHLDSMAPDLFVGMPIDARHVLGFVGSTGAGAPHLHFEARSGGIFGAYIDLGNPLEFVDVNPCGDVDYFGSCDGALLLWCENNALQSFDCASTGKVCGFQDDVVGNNCLEAAEPQPDLPEEPAPEEPQPEEPAPAEPEPEMPAQPEEAPVEQPDEVPPPAQDADDEPGIPLDRNPEHVVVTSPASCASIGGSAPLLLSFVAFARRRRKQRVSPHERLRHEIRTAHPELSEAEVQLLVVEQIHGKAVADELRRAFRHRT